eukprot:TRINITY_DN15117_c0_g2_i1.p1 TRINITY_DN15117_c0_g2~~TRINITY_DN15117_c0_g2_i1.p1  ORF type:complete len:302 (+),score=92.74 TRINITY_DN15117_c0_g2_i1:76-981(+)
MGKLTKDKRDIYYRRAKEEGWRARSAYKLLQVHEQFAVLDGVERAVDLCAAPGSWSQVLAQRIQAGDDGRARIVSVDLQEMAPIGGVKVLQGDITDVRTAEEIIDSLGGKADIVISDGAPDVTGMHDMDEYLQAQLVLAGLRIANCVLREGGSFVAKIFRGRNVTLLYAQLRCYFDQVTAVKPKSSRNQSAEAFVVCQGHRLPAGYDAFAVLRDPDSACGAPACGDDEEAFAERRCVVPFATAGDLSAYDSECAHAVEDPFSAPLPPVTPPIDAPYQTAGGVDERRRAAAESAAARGKQAT